MSTMSVIRPSAGEIVERGTRIYEDRLRAILEPQHNGKYVVIDVETGEYELDHDHLAASDRAAARRPGAPLYATRVGSPGLAPLGGRTQSTQSRLPASCSPAGRPSFRCECA